MRVSVTFLAGHGEICPPHGRSTWRPADQPTTRRSTWISCLFKEIKARNPCGSACCGLVCGSPCGPPMWGGKFRHGLLEKSLSVMILIRVVRCGNCRTRGVWHSYRGGLQKKHPPFLFLNMPSSQKGRRALKTVTSLNRRLDSLNSIFPKR